jgi:hypothetical protein
MGEAQCDCRAPLLQVSVPDGASGIATLTASGPGCSGAQPPQCVVTNSDGGCIAFSIRTTGEGSCSIHATSTSGGTFDTEVPVRRVESSICPECSGFFPDHDIEAIFQFPDAGSDGG